MNAKRTMGMMVLAGLATAGVAAASDDCIAGYAPAFYAVCLLDDHEYAAGGSNWASNRPVAAYATTADPYGAHAVTVGQYRSTYVWTVGDTTSSHARTEAAAYRSANGALDAGAGFSQERNALDRGGSVSTSRQTSAWAVACHGGTCVGGAVHQNAYEAGSYRRCSTVAYVHQVPGAWNLPLGPCDTSTPAGTLSTEVPQLYDTCVPTPTGALCGRFPDWPEVPGGLPFL